MKILISMHFDDDDDVCTKKKKLGGARMRMRMLLA
jgi:hypothetical protein